MGRRLGTIFRLLPGISDIVPLERTREKADSQEWLSYPAWPIALAAFLCHLQLFYVTCQMGEGLLFENVQ